MTRRKPFPNLSRVRKIINNLAPIIKRLRPSLQEDAARLNAFAQDGARVRDWLARERRKPKPPKRKKSAPQVSHRPIEPAEKPRRNRTTNKYNDPNNLEHIPLEERDLARLELLRASHSGPSTFYRKREELMKRFKIDKLPNRETIMGSFWGHLSGHRRKLFTARLLAMTSTLGKRRDEILKELARLYRVEPKKLVMEVDAQPTLH